MWIITVRYTAPFICQFSSCRKSRSNRIPRIKVTATLQYYVIFYKHQVTYLKYDERKVICSYELQDLYKPWPQIIKVHCTVKCQCDIIEPFRIINLKKGKSPQCTVHFNNPVVTLLN